MNIKNTMALMLPFLFIALVPVAADSGNGTEDKVVRIQHPRLGMVESKYYHVHDDNTVAHDLTMAMIRFEPDFISDPSEQLAGEWKLQNFQTTDSEMGNLVSGGAFDIAFDVTDTYMQVSLIVKSNNKSYADPEIKYVINDGRIVMENGDFQAGLKDGKLVYTMLGLDEAYRYTFVRK